MIRKWQWCVAVTLFTTGFGMSLCGQGPAPGLATIIEIEAENYTCYYDDGAEYSKLATDSNLTRPPVIKTFSSSLCVADIVRVDQDPVKGTWTARGVTTNFTPTPQPGQSAGDASRRMAADWMWEIVQQDGQSVGTIVASGFTDGPPPPGGPAALSRVDAGAMVISGGTGPYLGVRGQAGIKQITVPPREASASEDPARRRSHGGGAATFLLHLLPIARPTIWEWTPGEPWIMHENWSTMSDQSPAKSGEELIIVAIGLGPLRAPIDPGELYPRSPEGQVSSPVKVKINGKPAEVTKAIGMAEMYDVFELRFRMPSDLLPGKVGLRLVTGWIAGPEYRIPVTR